MCDVPLTKEEIEDIKASTREIKQGKCKRFTDVEEMLKELKR